MKKVNSTHKIEIREYSEKYKDKIREVIGKTLADISVIDHSSLPIDDKDLNNIKEIYSGKGRFWIAFDSNKVIGTVAIKDLGKNIAKLKRMFVLIDYHGSGIGQKLLDHAINFAKNQSFTKIILNTHRLMGRAHQFYEKNNFIKKDKKGTKFYRYERVL